MAKIVREELWKHPGHPGIIVVSTNSTITSQGLLVMGCGAARQARDRIPGIDQECARVVRGATRSIWSYPAPRGEMAMDAYWDECAAEESDPYAGVGYYFQVVREPSPDKEKVGFGIFQVKMHFRQPADLGLVYRSTVTLKKYAQNHLDTAVRMNYPGIGAGRLTREGVDPILAGLPDNVTICYR